MGSVLSSPGRGGRSVTYVALERAWLRKALRSMPPVSVSRAWSRAEGGEQESWAPGLNQKAGRQERCSRWRKDPTCCQRVASRPVEPGPPQVSLAKVASGAGAAPRFWRCFQHSRPWPLYYRSNSSVYSGEPAKRMPQKSADSGFFFSRETQTCVWVKVSLISCQHPQAAWGAE